MAAAFLRIAALLQRMYRLRSPVVAQCVVDDLHRSGMIFFCRSHSSRQCEFDL